MSTVPHRPIAVVTGASSGIGRGMRERGTGRILVTGSIAGLMPGSFQTLPRPSSTPSAMPCATSSRTAASPSPA